MHVLYGFSLGSCWLLLHLEVEAGLCPGICCHGVNDELGVRGRGRAVLARFVSEWGRGYGIWFEQVKSRVPERREELFFPAFALLLPLWFPDLCWHKLYRRTTDSPVPFHWHQLLLSARVPLLPHSRLAHSWLIGSSLDACSKSRYSLFKIFSEDFTCQEQWQQISRTRFQSSGKQMKVKLQSCPPAQSPFLSVPPPAADAQAPSAQALFVLKRSALQLRLLLGVSFP